MDHNICSVGAKTIFCWKLGTFEGLTCFTGFSNFLLTLQPAYSLTESASVLLLKENSVIFLILDLLFTYLGVYLIYTYQQFWNWFGKYPQPVAMTPLQRLQCNPQGKIVSTEEVYFLLQLHFECRSSLLE